MSESERTFCEHGVSHQPGHGDEQGRSEWCGECFPDDEAQIREAVAWFLESCGEMAVAGIGARRV